MADPGFVSQIEKLRKLADDPNRDPNDAEQVGKIGQQIAGLAHNDPRVMQALMLLQGMNLTVEEQDMKKAESVGDMPRREPVQLEHLALVKDIESHEEAKAKGNEYFKKGDLATALAHYNRGVELLRAGEEVPAVDLAALLSNAALCNLKLKWPDRAKKSASQAIAAIRHAGDTSFDQSKLFYRRALACEQLAEMGAAVDDMSRALQQAKKSNLSLTEQHRLKGEVERLKKLRQSFDEDADKKKKADENERIAEVKRMEGSKLVAKPDDSAKDGPAAPGPSGAYLTEQDFSHWARCRISEAVKGIVHKSQGGARIEVTQLDDEKSKIQASITTKKGKRALYYEMDLHLFWTGHASPQLRPANGPDEMKGLIRVYNIAHDTKFELGGDENVCYMYQLGWDQRIKGDWATDLQNEAAELFDLVAVKVDGVIHELKKK
eukprot:gnl/TRDRNA2_/TRDRNA2_94841_c0_seq1.p1 gnl/TRDRNA2_/TRDRNA2_94841_c0~~gnl/TRDRNA2_/TRDRNA2_94841_c0_seq1.p1  ORF type:complete len:506 (+),score=148.22 gnl/TRDRNA2_/TRDRNA2_94841_c0_seq1:214-1518(+)